MRGDLGWMVGIVPGERTIGGLIGPRPETLPQAIADGLYEQLVWVTTQERSKGLNLDRGSDVEKEWMAVNGVAHGSVGVIG